MKKSYLLMAVAGYIIPNIWVAIESYKIGNFLLWLDPNATHKWNV